MKHSNLKKAVEKHAPVQERHEKNSYYWAILQNRIISWHITWYEKQEQLASLVRVRHVNDKDDIQSDYTAGAFYDTIKSAIRDFTYDLQNKS